MAAGTKAASALGMGAILVAAGMIASCTFLVHYEDPDGPGGIVKTDASVIIPPGEDSSVIQPPAEDSGPIIVPDAGPKKDSGPGDTSCLGHADGDRPTGNPTPTVRCCNGVPVNFALESSNQNCGACGFTCLAGTQCVRSMQGYFFCVGCDPSNAGLGNNNCRTNCCSHSWDKAGNFEGPYVNTGVCTASNCAGACEPANCPAQSVCITPGNSSYPCVYQ